MPESSESQQHRLAIASPAAAVVATLGGIAAHFVVTLVLGGILITAAYAYGDLSSYDELYKLGRSPWLGFLGLALTGSVECFTALALLGIERTRAHAWLVPLIGIAVSILVVVFAIAGFHPPPPSVGG